MTGFMTNSPVGWLPSARDRLWPQCSYQLQSHYVSTSYVLKSYSCAYWPSVQPTQT